MAFAFEWDEWKEIENRRKHGVSFVEAKSVFNDPFSITVYDPDHSVAEDRYIDLGLSANGRLIVVSYTERGGTIRIISSRKATAAERERYEEE